MVLLFKVGGRGVRWGLTIVHYFRRLPYFLKVILVFQSMFYSFRLLFPNICNNQCYSNEWFLFLKQYTFIVYSSYTRDFYLYRKRIRSVLEKHWLIVFLIRFFHHFPECQHPRHLLLRGQRPVSTNRTEVARLHCRGRDIRLQLTSLFGEIMINQEKSDQSAV